MNDDPTGVTKWDFDGLNEAARARRPASRQAGGRAVAAALASGELQLDSPREEIDQVYDLGRISEVMSQAAGEKVLIVPNTTQQPEDPRTFGI